MSASRAPAPSTPPAAQSLAAATPAEQRSGLPLGLGVHLGPAVLFCVGLGLWGTTPLVVLPLFFALSLLNLVVVLGVERTRPCVGLREPTTRETFDGLVLVFVKGVGVGGAVVVGGWWLGSLVSPFTGATAGLLPIVLAVMATDYTYYWTHRTLSHGGGRSPLIRFMRRKHQLHHSVDELDFLWGNLSSLVDTAVTGFQLPLALIVTLLGFDLGHTLAAYGLVLMLQGTHHVNHTVDLGPLRWLFMDNHAHKLHHCRRGMLVNHGAMFSLWDRAHGTYFEDWTRSANHLHAAGEPLPLDVVRRSARALSPGR